MCLALRYEEARLWKHKAQQIIADATAAARKMPTAPLFRTMPDISEFVSTIDSIKKRHGTLIEEALISAINTLPNWSAAREKIITRKGSAHLDCLAYNSKSRQIYVFECKRGHGKHDKDAKNAIDSRLNQISSAIPRHAASKGWSPVSTQLFILSFYGQKWNSKYTIYDMNEIAHVFPPCVGAFVTEFARRSELEVSRTYQLYSVDLGSSRPPEDGTIFDELDDEPHPDEIVVFDPGKIRIEQRKPPRDDIEP